LSGEDLPVHESLSKQFIGNLLAVQPRIYGYIRAQVSNRADADDVLQETVSALWVRYDRFQSGTNFLAWACKTAHNKILHYYRRRARDRRLFSEEFAVQVARRAEQMDDELSGLQVALRSCMTKLPSVDRDVVQRCYASGATVASVSAELRRPVETIKSVLKRCRRALYQCIGKTLARERHE
jgi:RNA polymerase sigma-70 factor, ECF subfamily